MSVQCPLATPSGYLRISLMTVFPSPSGRPSAESSPIGTQYVHCFTSVCSTSSSILAGPPSSSCQEASSNVSHSITEQRLPGKGQNWRTSFVNINSIRGKVADLEYLLDYTRPDAVLISETKLGAEVNTQEVVHDAWGCTCCRKDRTLGGGGTMSNHVTYPRRVHVTQTVKTYVWKLCYNRNVN